MAHNKIADTGSPNWDSLQAGSVILSIVSAMWPDKNIAKLIGEQCVWSVKDVLKLLSLRVLFWCLRLERGIKSSLSLSCVLCESDALVAKTLSRKPRVAANIIFINSSFQKLFLQSVPWSWWKEISRSLINVKNGNALNWSWWYSFQWNSLNAMHLTSPCSVLQNSSHRQF